MKQNNWMKFKKALAILLVTTIMMAATAVTTLANEVQEFQVSPWAYGSLNEGERYDIFPTSWYYEDFQKPVTPKKLKILLEGVNKKLSKLNLRENTSFKSEAVGTGVTRGEVISLLYNVLGKYEMPAGSELTESMAVDYFQKRGILKGTGKGLELDKPCTVEQATVLSILLIEDAYNSARVGGKGFAWKATNKENTLYLLGSIHIGDAAMYPLRQEIKDAFKQSDALIVEAVMDEASMNSFIQQAMYTDGTTLKDHISEGVYNKALQVFEQFNLPTEQYIQFKPWSIANDLTVITGSNSDSLEGGGQAAALGVDLYFITTAHVTGKPVLELEGLAYQAELMNSLSATLQEENLLNILDSILTPTPAEEQTGADMVALWQKQWYEGNLIDFKRDYEEALGDSESEFNKMLLGKRDQEMADKLAILLEKEGKATYFVVVGAGHLAVEDMVIDLLKGKGYTVELFE